jgi:bacterioferritin
VNDETNGSSLSSIATLRARAREHIENGAVANSDAADRATVLRLLAHAYSIAARIVQLDGERNFDPRGLAERSHAEYVPGATLNEMIRENRVAERVAIDSCKEMVDYIGPRDPTTRRLLEEILAKEEEHAEDLSSMLSAVAPAARGQGQSGEPDRR